MSPSCRRFQSIFREVNLGTHLITGVTDALAGNLTAVVGLAVHTGAVPLWPPVCIEFQIKINSDNKGLNSRAYDEGLSGAGMANGLNYDRNKPTGLDTKLLVSDNREEAADSAGMRCRYVKSQFYVRDTKTHP